MSYLLFKFSLIETFRDGFKDRGKVKSEVSGLIRLHGSECHIEEAFLDLSCNLARDSEQVELIQMTLEEYEVLGDHVLLDEKVNNADYGLCLVLNKSLVFILDRWIHKSELLDADCSGLDAQMIVLFMSLDGRSDFAT